MAAKTLTTALQLFDHLQIALILTWCLHMPLPLPHSSTPFPYLPRRPPNKRTSGGEALNDPACSWADETDMEPSRCKKDNGPA